MRIPGILMCVAAGLFVPGSLIAWQAQEPSSLNDVPRQEPRTIGEIRHAIDALYQADVAWRHIGWQTCLLEGISRSRDQDKPILLWVFIDRPIDDERC